MKHLKALGAAILAAMALLALGGASSAQATVLCSTTATPCGSSWHVTTVHEVLDAGVTIRLIFVSIKITCTGATRHTTITPTGSSTTTAGGTIGAGELTWSGCSNTMHTLAGGTLEYHHIAGTDNATVTAKGLEITATLSGVSCTYGAGAGVDFGTLTGGSPAKLDVRATLAKVAGSFLCPSSGELEGTYEITSPSGVYVEPS